MPAEVFAMLEVDGLSAGYGRVQVLWDVDLQVRANEIVALVGPNGAGKTSLLRAISGMIAIRQGTASFRGTELAGRSIEQIVDLGIAHVPEGRRLFPGLTVRDNLRLGGWRNHNSDLDRVIELFPQLGDRLDQITGSMSGGEQQMCAIARGLMGAPALMMIDELSLGLAPVRRRGDHRATLGHRRGGHRGAARRAGRRRRADHRGAGLRP